MFSLRTVALVLLPMAASACTCLSPRSASGGDEKVLVNVDSQGLALEGYDVVAYFTDDKPVKGSAKFQTHYKGAYYRFGSAEHQKLFEANPAQYAPAYGGYCGYAASINRLSPVDPHFFQILDGRLVLQHNQRAWDKWNEDLNGNIVKADANWPNLEMKNATAERRLLNLTAGVALMGYDPVAYFTKGHPVVGDPKIEAVHDGARYHFESQANREIFERDPAHYAPAFGGYCGYAASINKVSPIDPTLFQIIDDRLVLQHTPKAFKLFNEDAPTNLSRADKNWPGLVACQGM